MNFVGFTENVKEELLRSSVFVLPSYREGVPLSTLEAMTAGRPIITTDVPGCNLTIDGNGFLIPPFCVESLIQAMMYFVDNPPDIATMGQKSFELARMHFSRTTKDQEIIKLIHNNQLQQDI